MKNLLFLLMAVALVMTACSSNNYTASMAGASDYSTVVVKDFTSLGIITVRATEIHHSGPFGFQKSVEGAKITFTDLMQEAAKLEADDIINVRIDMNVNYTKSVFDFFTGWTRTFTYTGTALAIKYTSMLNTETGDPQLTTLPKVPEATGAVKVTKSGKVQLR
jgi:ABC-type glycerol-3-phosphate transport system substrate-binding protein